MQNDILATLTGLSDATLVSRIRALIGRERDVTAEIVAHIAELDTRDVHLREGYTSLFVYCRDVLGLSDWEAYNRIEVARTVRRFPIVLGMLADGSVHLTAVRRLGPHLTVANHRDALESARGKTKAEIEEIVAGLSPRPDVPVSVRRIGQGEAPVLDAAVPVRSVSVGTPAGFAGPAGPEALVEPAVSAVDPGPCGLVPEGGESSYPALARAAAVTASRAVTPLSTDRYKLQLTISGETLEKLRLAQDMLGHAVPSGDEAAVVDRALTALLADLAKRKFGGGARPRRTECTTPEDGGAGPCTTPEDGGPDFRHAANAAMRKPAPRTPSVAVKRAVWVRDLGRCVFVGSGGHRCSERRFVEFHHVDPYALGGEASVDGIQLRCRSHNDYEGRLYFGKRLASRELVPEQVRLSTSHSMGAEVATAAVSRTISTRGAE
jgi:hypothetical protein